MQNAFHRIMFSVVPTIRPRVDHLCDKSLLLPPEHEYVPEKVGSNQQNQQTGKLSLNLFVCITAFTYAVWGQLRMMRTGTDIIQGNFLLWKPDAIHKHCAGSSSI